jgi:hypothetical protein
MPFLDNSIRRAPRNMEDIPIPSQGMFVDPIVRQVQEEMNKVQNDLNKRLVEARGGGGGGYPTPVKSESQQEMDAMMYSDAGLPPPSPYEQIEYK